MADAPRILDRTVGRNVQLLAQAAGDLATAEERFPYVRIMVSLIEDAHPEWGQAPHKADRIADLAAAMSNGTLDRAEVADVVRVRDEERGRVSAA